MHRLKNGVRTWALLVAVLMLVTSLPAVAHAAEQSQAYAVGATNDGITPGLPSYQATMSFGTESWSNCWTGWNGNTYCNYGSSYCNADGTASISGPGVEWQARDRVWSMTAYVNQTAFDWADPDNTEEIGTGRLTLCGRLAGGDPPLLGGCDVSNAYQATGTLVLDTVDGAKTTSLQNIRWGRVHNDLNTLRWVVTGESGDGRTFSMNVAAAPYVSLLGTSGCGDSYADYETSMNLSLQYSLTPKQAAQRLVIADTFPGQFEASTTTGSWALSGPVNGYPSGPTAWAALSLSGALAGTTTTCRDFRSGSGSGTLTRNGDTNTYNLYNLVFDVGAEGVSLYGQWITADGRRGRFGAVGRLADPWGGCRTHLSDALLVEDDQSAEELVALLQETAPQRPNTAPAVPQLVWPEDGHVFYPGEIQSFSVLTTDPEEDPYFGLIEVRQPGVNQYDAPWRTVVAPSGHVATGVPEEGPHAYQRGGPFFWRARASDLRLESPPSDTVRGFSVF